MAMNSREQILAKLRQAKRPFPDSVPAAEFLPMIPILDRSPAALRDLFVTEAQKAACVIHQVESPEAVIGTILTLIGQDTAISSWDLEHMPVPGLADALANANVTCLGQDATVRVGLTGVDAALAATGSIVVMSGNGRYRAASLLPPVHIAVIHTNQIQSDLESWLKEQKESGLERTRQHSNIVIVTGPSRTADIAMQLVMGMHGPRELHLVLFG
jgi:L-lactate dehydrogenase complex protein LldG